jgi:hypothetical protein
MLFHLSSKFSHFRLTKLREFCDAPNDQLGDTLTGATSEGSPGHHLLADYSIDGWFLETPSVGHCMVVLRFRRNETHRLGVFTSSPVTFVGESEIHTENSIYRLERIECAPPPDEGASPL